MKNKKVLLVVLILVVVAITMLIYNNYKKEETIKIGGIFPLTGVMSIWGESGVIVAQMAVDEINNNGGINGKKLELIIQDDQSDTKISVDVTNNLLNFHNINKYIHFAGATLSATAFLTKDRAIILNPSVRTENLFGKYPNVISVAQSVDEETKFLLDYIERVGSLSNLAIVVQSNDFGETYKNSFIRNYKNNNYKSFVHLVNERDFKSTIEKIKYEKIENIIITMNPVPTTIFLKQLKEMDIKANIYMVWLAESEIMFEEEVAEGIIYTYPINLKEDSFEIVDKFKEKNLLMHSVVFNSYDAVFIYAEILKKCDENDIECLIEEVNKIDFVGVGGRLTIQSDGTAKRDIYLKKIVGNEGIYILD